MRAFSLPWPFRSGGNGGGGDGSTEGVERGRLKDKKRGEADDVEERRLEEFGITRELRDYVKGFTVATFKDSPLRDDHLMEGAASSTENVLKDLTEWQERHATLVLSKVKEISQLRYVLCPRHLKDKQFWRIYFLLVKGYVAPYEIRAIQKAKLSAMGLENEKLVEKNAVEVEMTVSKHVSGCSDTSQCDHKPQFDGERQR